MKENVHTRPTPPSDLGLQTCSSSPVSPSSFAVAAVKDSVVESLPPWVDNENFKNIVWRSWIGVLRRKRVASHKTF